MWPDFRAEHILFEDGDLLVVHKPAGVPSQAADPERPDDLVMRLKSMLAARDGRAPESVYLGTHQRLDKDTSGVILFTKRADVNARVSAEIEQRKVTKRYVAGVIGWKGRPGKRVTLIDELARGDDGKMRVVEKRRGARPGQRAVSHVTTRAAVGDRAIVDVVLETGRTHQARVQLAHAGAPIVGDVLYGAEPRRSRAAREPDASARLMLHSAALEITHPRTNERLVTRDELERPLFDAWLERGDLGSSIYDDRAALDRTLALAVERRWALGRSRDRDAAERRTTAFRLVNEEGDGLPGLAVDVYGDHLVAQIYSSDEWDREGRRERALDALHGLGFDGVYLKLRPRQANVLVDTRRQDLAPSEPVRGSPTPTEAVTIYEEGVPYEVRLGDGLSTGIFLDQRRNRRAVREMARGARVANLFSYTCAFSITAALGGAAETVSVDAALIALERGRHGFTAAGLDPSRHKFVGEDSFTWLTRQAKKGELFDLVILDPPSYSSTKKRRFVAESDYDELVAMAAAIVRPKGKILACCNHRGMSRHKLRRLVYEGVKAANREANQVKDMPEGSDFPPAGFRDPHMKSVLISLR